MDYQRITSFLETAFWISVAITFYTYLGYGILLVFLVRIKNIFIKPIIYPVAQPIVSMIIAAYNEEDYIIEKLTNSLQLEYPPNLLEIIVVTDGSTDSTPRLVNDFPNVKLMHQPIRKGKISAVNRAVRQSGGEILVLTDANSLLNPEAITSLVKHYSDPRVGGVAGEKRVSHGEGNEGTEGEGFYWKYESALKTLDSSLYTTVGAAGELFSIRRDLWEELPETTIIEDFVQSLKVCEKGYVVRYEPQAVATESPSESVHEEMKRKIRICAGGFQAMRMLTPLLNLFKYPVAGFQYISHRVLRWTLAPLSLALMLLINISIVILDNNYLFYQVILGLQILFYFFALMGWSRANQQRALPLLTIPFYFLFMNVSVFLGLIVYMRDRHTVLWDKAARKENVAAGKRQG